MDRLSLILNVPGLPPERLDFETAPSEANQSEPHMLTLVRLPQGGTYRESHGEGIIPLTLRGSFGYERRSVGGQAKSGFDLFRDLRNFYRKYVAQVGSKDPRIANGTRLEYHNHTEDEHYYAEASEFRTPRGPENRTHYIYELDLKLTQRIKRKLPVQRPSKTAVIGRLLKSMKLHLQNLQKNIEKAQKHVQGFFDTIDRDFVKPLAELAEAAQFAVDAGTGIVNFSVRKITDIINAGQQILEDLGNLPSVELTEFAQTVSGARRSLIRLAATPGAIGRNFNERLGEFNRELAAWDNFENDVEREAATAGFHAETRAIASALTSNTASGVRSVETRANDSLQKIALRELGDASRWFEIALLNGLERAPYIDSSGGEGIASWGDTLLIPTNNPQDGQGVAGALEDPALSYQKKTEERLYGRDIRLKEKDGKLDISFASDGKLATIAGRDNLLQAVTLKTRIFQGQLLENGDFGLRRLVGKRMGPNDLDLTKWGLQESAESDPRIESVEVTLDATGNYAESTFAVTPVAASDSRTTDSLSTP